MAAEADDWTRWIRPESAEVFVTMRSREDVLCGLVDLYSRAGCAMRLEPIYGVVRENGVTRVERAWQVTVYRPTSAPEAPRE